MRVFADIVRDGELIVANRFAELRLMEFVDATPSVRMYVEDNVV